MHDAQRIRHSPIGLWIQAYSDAWQSIETGDPVLTEKTLQECEYVDFLFRDHPFALNLHLQAFVGAVEYAQTPADKERYIQQGQLLAEKLENDPDAVWGDWPRWLFYRAMGDAQKATAAIRRVGSEPTTYCWFLCRGLSREAGRLRPALQEFEQAIALEHRTSKYVRLAEARVACTMTDHADRVRDFVRRLAR